MRPLTGFPPILFSLLASSTLTAGTIAVESGADNVEADEVITLREAILISEGALARELTDLEKDFVVGEVGAGQPDRIEIQPAVTEIVLSGPLPEIKDENTSIVGTGADRVVINGNGNRDILKSTTCAFRVEKIAFRNYDGTAATGECVDPEGGGEGFQFLFRDFEFSGGEGGLSWRFDGADGIQVDILKGDFRDQLGNGLRVEASAGGLYDFSENRFEGVGKVGSFLTFGDGTGEISLDYRANHHSDKDEGSFIESLEHEAAINLSLTGNFYLGNRTGLRTDVRGSARYDGSSNEFTGNVEAGARFRSRSDAGLFEADVSADVFKQNDRGVELEIEGKAEFTTQMLELSDNGVGVSGFVGVNGEGFYRDSGSSIRRNTEVGARFSGVLPVDFDIFWEETRLEDNREGAVFFRIGEIRFGGDTVFMDNVRIVGNQGNGLQALDSHVEVRNSLICHNGKAGIDLASESRFLIEDSVIDQNGQFALRNRTPQDVTAVRNDWGPVATAEMKSQPFPSDISAIFDQFDETSHGQVDYSNWVEPSSGCSLPPDPVEDFFLYLSGERAEGIAGFDIRNAGVTLTPDLLVATLNTEEPLPLIPESEGEGWSFYIDLDGNRQTGLRGDADPLRVMPLLGVDLRLKAVAGQGQFKAGADLLDPAGSVFNADGIVAGFTTDFNELTLSVSLAQLSDALFDSGSRAAPDPSNWRWLAVSQPCPIPDVFVPADSLSDPGELAAGEPRSLAACAEAPADFFPDSLYAPQRTIRLFPYLRLAGNEFTGFALANLSGKPALLDLDAFDGLGRPWSKLPAATVPLESGNQLASLGGEFFSAPEGSNSWVESTATAGSFSSFFLVGDPTLKRLDGAVAQQDVAKRLIFPRILHGEDVFRGRAAATRISIANPGVTPVTFTLRLSGLTDVVQDGDAGGESVVVLPPSWTLGPKEVLLETIDGLFGDGIRVDSGYLDLVVEEGLGVIGLSLIEFPEAQTLVALNGLVPSDSAVGFSPQLVSSTEVFSSINLINSSGETRFVTLAAIGDQGLPAFPETTLRFEPGVSLTVDLAELAAIPASTLNTVGDIAGSLQVRADGPGIIGDILFGDPETLDFATAVPLDHQPSRRMVFSQVANGLGLFTGFAFQNPDADEAALLLLEVFDSFGVRTGAEVIVLPPSGRTAQLLTELVPNSSGQIGGYVAVSSTLPVIGQQIFGSLNLTMFSSVPAQKMDP